MYRNKVAPQIRFNESSEYNSIKCHVTIDVDNSNHSIVIIRI